MNVNILYLAHRLPYPPNKGDKIRSFHQIEYLSRRHRIWCACFVDDPADMTQVDVLRGHCRALAAIPLNRKLAAARGLAHLLCGGTLTEGFYDDRRMWATLRKWSDSVDFDAVMVFSSSMAPYGSAVAAWRRVIDFCDWDSLKWAAYAQSHRGLRSLLMKLEARRLDRRERQWINEYDASVVITAAEAEDLPDLSLRSRVSVVRNGVELRPYSPPPTAPRVGFVGAMDYTPNVDAVCRFAEHTWPLIRSQVPEATFRIVGTRPRARVRALAGHPGIDVVGQVADVGPYVDECPVHAILLRIARGLQNKVLEAMAAGRAVVLSSAAARGIGGKDSRDYLIADDAESAAKAIVSLLRDPDHASALGRSARAFVQKHFNWNRELGRLEALLTNQDIDWEVRITECPAAQRPRLAVTSQAPTDAMP